MALLITDDTMVLEIGNCVVATARFGEHVAADGSGAWIVWTCFARLFDRDQAMTALMVVELSVGELNRSPIYNLHRPHRALRQGPPAGRPYPPDPGANVRVLRRDRLGGLIHEYSQVA